MKKKIKDLIDLQMGLQFRQKTEPVPDAKWRVVQLKDFDENRTLDWEAVSRFQIETNPSRYLLKSSDVLFLFRGARFFAHAVADVPANTLASGYFYILRPKEESILSEYLAWYLNSKDAHRHIHSIAKQGSQMPYIQKGFFQDITIPVPPLDIQTKIVELDRLQRHENALIAQIQERRKTLLEAVSLRAIHQVLTQ